MTDYHHGTLDDFETNPEKPGRRWELSPPLGIDAYNFNVAILAPGDPLSQSGYHYHESQAELFYVIEGRCRVEIEDGGFTLDTDGVVHFAAGVTHLLHNPFDEPCKVVAVGSPPEGRYPVHQVASAEELLDRRYGDPSPSSDRIDDSENR
jgi:uncharacterized cupin superfamily protein